MFRPFCGHLQANLDRSSTFNVRTIWDPIVCTYMAYVRCKPQLKIYRFLTVVYISHTEYMYRLWDPILYAH